MTQPVAIGAVVAVAIVTAVIGVRGVRVSRTPADFLVAAREVPPVLNASAISGEYLSAASFLGIAALAMQQGIGALWYAVGYAGGYLVLLAVVAAPLRRFGAYTIPDFAEGRLDSRRLRQAATIMVLVICGFYVLPQLKGAGITLQEVFGLPYWAGVAVLGAVVTAAIASGGMKGITMVQAFQFWLKISALAIPALCLLAFVHHAPLSSLNAPTPPASSGPQTLSGSAWLFPMVKINGMNIHPLAATYGVILATFFGALGLPHILVRFYTNPDGQAARRTTSIVLLLLSCFYVFPAIFAVLGRLEAPGLYATGQTDTVVLLLPRIQAHGTLAQLLAALTAAGAFAAFLSTTSGLLIAMSGAISHDILRRGSGTFRAAAVAVGVISTLCGLAMSGYSINVLVGWAFAIAASSFCPLLILGIWWPRLTWVGGLAGLIVGGGAASGAVVATMAGAGQ
ncbi:MAG: cation acetate symporter, partial [Acidimicrobiaceae bacterium]|nr:cation acetate symporter [Acidimicrobiaceae bacterium]